MSNEGKLKRGLKWYSMRGQDNILPEDIANDPNKMCDVEFYLHSLNDEAKSKEAKPKDEKKGK